VALVHLHRLQAKREVLQLAFDRGSRRLRRRCRRALEQLGLRNVVTNQVQSRVSMRKRQKGGGGKERKERTLHGAFSRRARNQTEPPVMPSTNSAMKSIPPMTIARNVYCTHAHGNRRKVASAGRRLHERRRGEEGKQRKG
jgi:hypothetical protein